MTPSKVEAFVAGCQPSAESSEAVRITEVVGQDGTPVAAPCAISGCQYGRLASANTRTTDDYKAVALLIAVRDQWYGLTGYSQLKVDIDELLDRLRFPDREANK